MYKGKYLAVVIAAGGVGARFGGDLPKQFLEMGGPGAAGRNMLEMSADLFLRGDLAGFVDEVVFVVPEGYEGIVNGMTKNENEEGGRGAAVRVVVGGADRAGSVRAGLAAVSAGDGLVLIHDAARPFASAALALRVLEAAYLHGAAVPCVGVRDTVYTIDNGKWKMENGGVAEWAFGAPDRGALRAAQTPQGFDLALIREAHERALAGGLVLTDDGGAALARGGRVALVEGEDGNIKVTVRGDFGNGKLRIENGKLKGEGGGEWARVGIGFDAHRFVSGRPLILGGVEIPFERGLLGHSDADVVAHALMDAVLGALHMGDIGKMFPDTDPAYAGVSSMKLLGEVATVMQKRGFEIGNADITVVCERPKIAPHCAEMEKTLAAALGTAAENVSVKGTTTERLGFTGREEGIAAQAVVLLARRYDTGPHPA